MPAARAPRAGRAASSSRRLAAPLWWSQSLAPPRWPATAKTTAGMPRSREQRRGDLEQVGVGVVEADQDRAARQLAPRRAARRAPRRGRRSSQPWAARPSSWAAKSAGGDPVLGQHRVVAQVGDRVVGENAQAALRCRAPFFSDRYHRPTTARGSYAAASTAAWPRTSPTSRSSSSTTAPATARAAIAARALRRPPPARRRPRGQSRHQPVPPHRRRQGAAASGWSSSTATTS